MDVKKYVTIHGDTWDQISYTQYGDSKLINLLMKANREQIGTIIFEAGETLKVPPLEVKHNENIAPWRR
ncbi:MAG: tail protein X [Fusobacteriaceae bacterium]